MILAFKKEFVKPILDGTKIHTIRSDKPNRWKAGMKIQMATGVRTKQYECFNESQCVSVQNIVIVNEVDHITVLVDGKVLSFAELCNIARNDGFDGYNESQSFIDFFGKGVFKGKIIHWTDYKY